MIIFFLLSILNLLVLNTTIIYLFITTYYTLKDGTSQLDPSHCFPPNPYDSFYGNIAIKVHIVHRTW